MLKCRDVGENATEFLSGALPWRVRLLVVWHLLTCGNCRMVVKQLLMLLTTLRRRPAEPPSDAQIQTWLAALDHDHGDHNHSH